MIDLEGATVGPFKLLTKLGRGIRKMREKESTMANMTPGISEGENDKITTVIADDLEIKGIVKFESSLMTKGVIEGEIISQGLLIVGPTARVTATITTKDLISHGEIHGDVTATDKAVLKKTAVHEGDITTPSIVIEGGSVFNGSCIMQRRPRTIEARGAAAEAAPPIPEPPAPAYVPEPPAPAYVPEPVQAAQESADEAKVEEGAISAMAEEDTAEEDTVYPSPAEEGFSGIDETSVSDETKGEDKPEAEAHESGEPERDETEKTEGIWSFDGGDYPRKSKLF